MPRDRRAWRPEAGRARLRAMPSAFGRRPSGIRRASPACRRTTSVRQMALFKTGQRANAARRRHDRHGAGAVRRRGARRRPNILPSSSRPPATTRWSRPTPCRRVLSGAGGMRFAAKDGGTEPIGERIIVLPHGRDRGQAARSAFRLHRLCAERQHRQGPGAGHHRRQRQDRAMRRLPRTRARAAWARCRRSPAAPRPTSSASSTTSKRGSAQRRRRRVDEARGRQPDDRPT